MGYPVGIVSAISGIHQMIINIEGISAHAGAMPMSKRKDALAAAAHIACEVERLANSSGSGTRGTVGYIKAQPGEHNIIAAKAEVPVDIREADAKIRQGIFNDLMSFTDKICKDKGLKWNNKMTLDAHPVESDLRIVAAHKRYAKVLGIPHMDIISYAAHDSLVLAELCPVGMIFVRSIGGLSHRPEEYTTKEDLAAGTGILLGSVLEISQNGLK